MAVPRARHTKSKRNKRRMHLFLEKPFLVSCSKCGKPKNPHTICWSCGYYKGKEVIDVFKKLTKKERKKKEKEMAAKEKGEKKEERKKPIGWKELSRK